METDGERTYVNSMPLFVEGSNAASRLANRALLVKVGRGSLRPRREDWFQPGKCDELTPHVARLSASCADVNRLVALGPRSARSVH